MALIPPVFEAVEVCVPALPPGLILAFDGHGILLGIAYIGSPVMTMRSHPTEHADKAFAAPPALPPLPPLPNLPS